MTLGFNKPETIEMSMKRLVDTCDNLNRVEKVLVDLNYPLPNKKQNTVRLAELSSIYDYTLLKPHINRGVSGNWMWVMNELDLKHEDVLIGMDPDSEPQQKGWVEAITRVLTSQPKVAYVGLKRTSPPGLSTESDESNRRYVSLNVSNERVRLYQDLIAWPMGGFQVSFMKDYGLHQKNNRYGHIEYCTDKVMKENGYQWLILEDYEDATSCRGDALYKAWKVEQANMKTDLDFENWLIVKGFIK